MPSAPGPYPSVEEAERHLWTPHELAIAEHARDRSIVGTPDAVRERLKRLAEEHGAEELVVVTITPDFGARVRSYELLAAAFGLPGAMPSAETAVPS